MEDDDRTCLRCRGIGEGDYEGQVCPECKGRGEIKPKKEWDDYEGDERGGV